MMSMPSQQSDSPISESQPGAEPIERQETFSESERLPETINESGDPDRDTERNDHSCSILDGCALLLSHE